MSEPITGQVVKVLDEYSLVINRGSADGVKPSNVFLVYGIGEDIIDPETGEDLGTLEIVRGEGKPQHIQEKMTTLRTSRSKTVQTKKIVKKSGFAAFGETEEIIDPEKEEIPFDESVVGDHCKQIR